MLPIKVNLILLEYYSSGLLCFVIKTDSVQSQVGEEHKHNRACYFLTRERRNNSHFRCL